MKKLTYSLIAGLSLLVSSAWADSTASFTLHAGTLTGIYTNGPIRVTGLVIQAPTATNALIQAVDSANGWLIYTNSAYTNTVSWVTNLITTWTNFYGAINSFTNYSLVDIVTNPVPATTNNYWPVKITAAASANSATVTADGSVSYTFWNGLWVTNQGSGDVTITFNYRRLY